MKQAIWLIATFIAIIILTGCSQNQTTAVASRYSKIPADAVKMNASSDSMPPILYSEDYNDPVPVSGKVNSAGAEDSAFIMPDGNTLYFFFTPDVRVPVEKQIIDGVTGIYVSKKQNGEWGEPERIILQDKGKIAGDGCEFVLGNTMWFCSVREGYTGVNLFTAEFKNGRWQNWKYAGDLLNKEYQAGEMTITSDGKEMYFHSYRPGGQGGLDIWMSANEKGQWQLPENVEAVNTDQNEGWPFVTPDGTELWFTRTYLGSPAIYMSKKANGEWQAPDLIISQFAGEPSVDNQGNVYFTHHFYKDNKMIEADIYVAHKK